MSDTQGSTVGHEEAVSRFKSNPVGFVVRLQDGSEAEVRGFRDTPRARWYRLKRRGGPWVPEEDVVGVMIYTVGLRHRMAPTEVSA